MRPSPERDVDTGGGAGRAGSEGRGAVPGRAGTSERGAVPGRSLVAEVLGVQLAITAVIGIVALVGLAWTSGSVIRNNLEHWAAQWAAELDELGAPFYLSNEHDAILGVERFIAKYPEIERVTWYLPNGGPMLALDENGVALAPASALDDEIAAALAAKAGAEPPYLLTEDVEAGRRFRLSGPVWTEALEGDGLFGFDPETAETSIELLGFVSVDLDFTPYASALRPRLVLASVVLLALLGAGWALARFYLKRALAPLSNLQQPLAELALGNMGVKLPSSNHRELETIVGALDDTIQSLKKREQHLMHLASHDVLTGLYNRHRLLEELEDEVALCAETKRGSAIFFIDLDQFKYINDTCGHAAGDELLKSAALQIRHAVRSHDFVARFGGDEFIVLLRDVTRWEARSIATQVLELMRSLAHVNEDRVFHLQCSIGAAMISSARFSAHELIAQADIACQTAKVHGRNRVEFYSVASKQSEQMEKDVHWMRNIRAALENDSFVLHFQPLMHIASRRITCYEALLRIKNGRGLMGPATFLPAAARFGLMADIDAWVIEHALKSLAELGADDPDLKLSINLSSFAFEDRNLANRVRSLLRDLGVAGDRVVFEITEQLAVRFAANIDKQVASLRDLGCRFAVDDFGTGYSSFAYLKRLPVDYLKIDGSFIKRLKHDRVDQSMVRMVAEVARAARMETVAEYVQSAGVFELLEKYGIDYAQGHYIGRAVAKPRETDAWRARSAAARR